MVIGFDAKRAVSNNTGLGNYSRLVIEGIGKENPDDRLLLYTPKLKNNPRLSAIRELPNAEFRLPPAQGFKGALWRTLGIPNHLRQDGVDVYLGLSNELPLNIRESRVASVVTIHDVIYRRLPHCYKATDRLLYDYKYGHSCRHADRIIAVSECTKRDIVEFYGINPDKISVCYQGCDASFGVEHSEKELEETRKRYGLPERYLLQVGTIEERKNLELTVKALANIDNKIGLAIVGRDRGGYKKEIEKIAKKKGILHRLHFLKGVPFSDLPLLTQRATAICYPSRYEGFGIPVLEGLTARRPVIAATGSCLEEAGGEGAIYVNPDSVDEMTMALESTLRGGSEIEEMIKRGIEHASKFDLGGVAARVKRVLTEASCR